jgi:hypothetical protein
LKSVHPHRVVEDLATGRAAPLGDVRRGVGVAKYIIGRAVAAVGENQADAGGGVDGAAGSDDGVASASPMRSASRSAAGRSSMSSHRRGELVAAAIPDIVMRTDRPTQPVRHLDQDCLARPYGRSCR